MHFLCLHGAGSNSQILEAQTAALRYELGDGHTYDYAEGVTRCPIDPAGISMEQVHGTNTSVYIGCFTNDFKTLYEKDLRDEASYAATGITTTLNANRISWFFNLLGPSVNVDTACSSSLVALDFACQNIWSGSSDMCLVGGANLLLAPDLFHTLSGMNMLSPDGRCWSFDSRGNGYGRGEGVGVLVIKRLRDAIRDGDIVRAVIRSTASNQDGHTVGVTQPSRSAQERLINHCYEKAGLDKSGTVYVEAHGTGTPVGDPIEAAALGAAFSRARDPAHPLYVGSIKANIGHLEGASGIAGVIKAVAILEKGVIPPVADLNKVNPQIDEKYLGINFPRKVLPWPKEGLRRVSVNSFGFGGSNAHAILDGAYQFLLQRGLDGIVCFPVIAAQRISSKPIGDFLLPGSAQEHLWLQSNRNDPSSGLYLLPFSAASSDAIRRVTETYTRFFHQLPPDGQLRSELLKRLAYTLAQKRSLLSWRGFTVFDPRTHPLELEFRASTPLKASVKPKLAFAFTGQGAQWPGMGKELLKYDEFRKSLQEAELYLRSLGCEWNLIEKLLNISTSQLEDPLFSQILCTSLQVAIVDLLCYFNVRPDAIIGHSSGEIAAAYCCGAISRSSAWKIAYLRGIHTSNLYKGRALRGSMMAVGLSSDEATQLLHEQTQGSTSACIACYNSPSSVTVSGEEKAICSLKAELDRRGVFARKLRATAAYHSRHMNLISSDYLHALGTLESGNPSLHGPLMLSTVTGNGLQHETLQTPAYWVENMVQPVGFSQAFERFCAKRVVKKIDRSHCGTMKIDTCLEIGPHSALRGPIRDILASKGANMGYIAMLERSSSALQSMMQAMGRLWCLGHVPHLSRVNRVPDGTLPLSDLPSYPFDHSQKYFHESRMSRSHRLQNRYKTRLLGDHAMDWNPVEPQWRSFLSVSEYPWIEHHKINGIVVFPAVSMLSMAIEATAQVNSAKGAICGYEFRDIKFHIALTVPESQNVEIQFFLHFDSSITARDRSWASFRLCGYIGSNWENICTGGIRVQHTTETSEVDHGQGTADLLHELQQDIVSVTETGTSASVDSLYTCFRNCGMDYGPLFRNIESAHILGRQSAGTVRHCKWPSCSCEEEHQDTVAFSGMLDALLQLALVSYTKGGGVRKPTLVPSHIRKACISKYAEDWAEETCVNTISSITSQTDRGTEFNITSLASDGSRVFAQLEGAKMTVVDTISDPTGSATKDVPLCWNPVWLPDIELMGAEQLSRYCAAGLPNHGLPIELYQQLSALQLECLQLTLRKFGKRSGLNAPSYFSRYIEWAEGYVKRQGQIVSLCQGHELGCEARIEEQARCLEQANAQGKVHAAVARNMRGILLAEIDPLDLFFGDSLLEDLYIEHSKVQGCFSPLRKYLHLYSHKNPHAEYLEIGAGTGGSTLPVLTSLKRDDISQPIEAMYKRYTFTDISETFFPSARARFSSFPRLDFRRLDIEQPGVDQGILPESYDMIIAANVLHATRDLSTTLRNVNMMLRSGGKLILHEVVDSSLGITAFAMGLLPGWWLGTESFRSQGPCISVDCWHHVLQESGFSGVDQEFPDYNDVQCHELSVLISTKLRCSETPSEGFSGIDIITDQESSGETELANSLQRVMLDLGNLDCKRESLRELRTTHTQLKSVAIIIDNLERSLLYSLDSPGLQFLQQQLRLYRRTIWISKSVGDGSSHPSFGMASGLVRSWQTEVEDRKHLRIGLATYHDLPMEHLQAVRDIILRLSLGDAGNCELEYEELDGFMSVCRLQIDGECRNAISGSRTDETVQQTDWLSSKPLRLVAQAPGLLESLMFVEDDTHSQPLAPDEVEIEVRSMGLNFKDCLIALGRIPGGHLGNECSGIVRALGSACEGQFQLGDRVCMSTSEAFKTYARSKAQCVCRLSSNMSFVEGAAIPTQFVTAWTCLHDIARLAKGETALVHAGAGGTGQAAIQICRHLGAHVVTVGSKQKKDLLVSEYGIPNDHILYSRDNSFSNAIKRITKGRGVDVVLNSLAGDGLLASWECLAPYGRFIEIGKQDILANSNLPMFPFNKGVTFSAFDGSMWVVERPHEAQKNIQTVMNLFEAGHLHTAKPLAFYDIADIKSAISTLAHGRSSGKHVVQVSPTAVVTASLKRQMYTLSGDSTYVIAGGFGGIGRTIAKWMASKGARYFIILSRSGIGSSASLRLVDDLQMAGATVQAPSCDISNEAELRHIISDCSKAMPPIRGCVHASMVLQDVLFDRMSHADWEASTAPKVSGSWNLHQALPETLDFFILLSSVSGIIGHRGQSNYAAGNTFQDALAHYRVARGRKAVSINLGAMVDDGYLAETDNKHIRDRLLAAGVMQPITRQDLFSLLERYCDPSLEVLGLGACQVACGINTPLSLQARGLDEPAWLQRSMFGPLYWVPTTEMPLVDGDIHKQAKARDFRQAFIEATTLSKASQVVTQALLSKVSQSISQVTTADSEIDANRPVVASGVDSLLAVDLRGWLRKVFQADVPTFEIMGGTSFVAMGVTVANRSGLKREASAPALKDAEIE